MIEGDAASRFMLKIESFVTTLASIDCAIRWSNLFSMTLKPVVFGGLVALQSLATLLLIVGVAMTIWELWTNRSSASRFRSSTSQDAEEGRGNYRYYVLCEIPVHTSKKSLSRKPSQKEKSQETEKEVEPKSTIQVRAKKEIWFTAASAFIDDFLVPCVFWILFENDCAAYNAAGGNSWFDIAEATVGVLAALFVWIIVGALLLRVATLLRKGECAAKAPICLRWFLCVLVGTLGVCAVGFSLLQGGGLGLFLSTECSLNGTKTNSTSYSPLSYKGLKKLTSK